jgi:hypothetical protein
MQAVSRELSKGKGSEGLSSLCRSLPLDICASLQHSGEFQEQVFKKVNLKLCPLFMT